MGLTPFDVQNLNNAIAGVGNTFAEGRKEDRDQQRLDIEQSMRQKMLDAELRRLTLEQGRQETLGQGSVDTWLQSADGGTMHFTGPQNGLQTLMQQSEAKGKPLKQLTQPPTAKPQYGVFRTSTPIGDMEFHLDSPDQVDNVATLAKKMGGKAVNHASSQPAAVAQDTAAAALEEQADALEAQAGTVGPGGTDSAQQWLAQANKLRERAKFLRTPRYDPSQFVTERETTVPDPITGQPTTRTTNERKVPIGATGAPPTAGTPTAMQGKIDEAGLRADALASIARGKDPVAVRDRYKKLTGKDL